MSFIGYIIAFVIGFAVVLLLGYFRSKVFSTIVIISAVFGGFTVALAAHLEHSISSEIKTKALIAKKEEAVIQKLKLIREAEIAYLEVNGNYTSDWDKLINFVKNGKFPIIQRKERVVTLSYGADSSIVTFDTLGIISARERIFKGTYNVNAANNGNFVNFMAASGDVVQQGNSAYVLEQNGKNVTHKFRQGGKITKQEQVFPGQEVTKGDLLMTLTETKFKEDTDLDRLAYVPGYDDVKFDIYAAEVDKSGVSVDVIEVKNPRPFDPAKSEDAEMKNLKPLRFGSKTDVTTSGNWE